MYSELLVDFMNDHVEDYQKIAEALVLEDIETAHRMAHTLKGVAGGIGAQTLFEDAQKIDELLREGILEGLEPLLEILSRDLRLVVKDIQKKIAGQAPSHFPDRSRQPLDMANILSLIDVAQELAGEMDPEAEEKSKEIRDLLHAHDSSYTDLGTRLVEQTADLDFGNAIQTLLQLRKSLGLAE